MNYTECCVGTWKTLYCGFPEDGSLAMKRVEILYFMNGLQSFVCICWLP